MLISVDVEASGPCPNHGDLISFGMVLIDGNDLSKRFRSPNMKPSCSKYKQGAYDSIGITREEHESYAATLSDGMNAMKAWLDSLNLDRRVMISDNPAFDFMWIAAESYNHLGYNPFGHSARRIGDVWAGYTLKPNSHTQWKKFRKTKHTHDPLDDALGNAEAWLTILEKIRTA